MNIADDSLKPEERHTILLLRQFCLYLKRQFLRKKYKNLNFGYVKGLHFRRISKIKKFSTKNS